LHHVIVRGIARRAIFRDDRDRDVLVERLGALLQESGGLCFAWALIPNHFHLLLRTGRLP
jgi:REP element-mobilizing transposase RayT